MALDATPSGADRSAADALLSARQWIELSERIAICGRLLRSLIAPHCDRSHLSDSQLSLVWACLGAPPDGIGQRDLARLLVVSPAHISEGVEQLRRQGLLAGRRDLHDRRRQHWQATPAGAARFEILLEHLAAWAWQLDSQLDPADLLSRVNRLLAVLSDGPAAGANRFEALKGTGATGVAEGAPVPQRGVA